MNEHTQEPFTGASHMSHKSVHHLTREAATLASLALSLSLSLSPGLGAYRGAETYLAATEHAGFPTLKS